MKHHAMTTTYKSLFKQGIRTDGMSLMPYMSYDELLVLKKKG